MEDKTIKTKQKTKPTKTKTETKPTEGEFLYGEKVKKQEKTPCFKNGQKMPLFET